MEPHDLWKKGVPERFRAVAREFPPPKLGENFQAHEGGRDPYARMSEMSQDGVSAEVLYPTLGLALFAEQDAALQEAEFRVYNDWLIEYCQPNLDRLVGLPCISLYDVDHAVKELERCTAAGLKGAVVWQSPHPSRPFHSEELRPFWDAAQSLDAPVSLHILTGFNYSAGERTNGPESYRGSVNLKTMETVNALFDFIFFGVLDRYPSLKLVLVENEIGWMPFFVQQWDYYYHRFRKTKPLGFDQPPSFYVQRQVFATFFNDAVGGHNLDWWGQDNCMWSNDFPHPNSTWPHSREVIERSLGHLSSETLRKVLRETVVRLYGMNVPELADASAASR